MSLPEPEAAYLIAMLLKGKVGHGRIPSLNRDLRALYQAGLVRWEDGDWTPTDAGEQLMHRHYPG